MIWAIIICAIAVLVLGALIDYAVIKKARWIKVAEVSKVALACLKDALADGTITKKEFLDGIQKILDEVRRE